MGALPHVAALQQLGDRLTVTQPGDAVLFFQPAQRVLGQRGRVPGVRRTRQLKAPLGMALPDNGRGPGKLEHPFVFQHARDQHKGQRRFRLGAGVERIEVDAGAADQHGLVFFNDGVA